MHPIGQEASPATPDGIWMTKAEIAVVRRISVASADRLVRRQGWRKERGNDGRARVLVPLTWAQPRPGNPRDETSGPKDTNPTDKAPNPTDVRRTISALETAVNALEQQLAAVRAEQLQAQTAWAEQLAALQGELDRTRAEVGAQRSRADRAEGVIEGMKAATDARAEEMRSELSTLKAEVAQRQTDQDRHRLGLVGRLRAVFRP